MKKFILIVLTFYSLNSVCQNQTVRDSYESVYSQLNSMMSGSTPISFKKAVLLTESAYFDNKLDTSEVNKQIVFLSYLCHQYSLTNELQYSFKDKEEVKVWASIFKIMTDTISVLIEKDTAYHLPYSYDFDDFFGEKDWSKMFVSKLLDKRSGNCHSLPFLYKILAEELGASAQLALAPNHIYIKHKSQKTGMYNTELTSAAFPIDAWIMASGYIHLDAIQNGLYMKALNENQSIAICMVDLAEGYKRKTNNTEPEFILKCCNTALEYFPDYINALILKAETLKSVHGRFIKDNPNPGLETKSKANAKFLELQDLYARIHQLGYRQMPKEMYLKWLVELKTEREKYQNKSVSSFNSK